MNVPKIPEDWEDFCEGLAVPNDDMLRVLPGKDPALTFSYPPPKIIRIPVKGDTGFEILRKSMERVNNRLKGK